jgi:hypothetical protein
MLPRYSGIFIIIYITVLVRTVTITPSGDSNVVYIMEGETQTFTCTTDSSRPASWIQWYIGEQNVTNQAIPQPPQQDGDKFISSSSLVYRGRPVDHSKVIFCEAVNIEGRQKVNSTEQYLHIHCKRHRSGYFMKNCKCYLFHSFIVASYSSWRMTVTGYFTC